MDPTQVSPTTTGQPIDADQNQFMQDNAQQIAQANPWQPAQNSNPAPIDYNNPSNETAIFSSLMRWEPVQQNTPVVQQAQKRMAMYKTMNGATPEQLWDAIYKWTVKQWTQTLSDIQQYNPDLYANAMKIVTNKQNLDHINWVWATSYSSVMTNTNLWNKVTHDMSTTTTPTDVLTPYNDQIKTMLENQFGPDASKWYELSQSMMNSPQIQWQAKAVADAQSKVNKINDDLSKIDSDIRWKLWSEAPESLISAYVWEQTKVLSWQLKTAQNNLTLAQSSLNSSMDEVDKTLGYIKTWWAEDVKKKTGSGSWTSDGTWAESLFNARLSWDVADSELFNATTLKKYWLKWATRWQVIQAFGELASNSDTQTVMDKVNALWWANGDALYSSISKWLAKNKPTDLLQYYKKNTANETDFSSLAWDAFKGTDKATLEKNLADAGITGKKRYQFWKPAGWANDIINKATK